MITVVNKKNNIVDSSNMLTGEVMEITDSHSDYTGELLLKLDNNYGVLISGPKAGALLSCNYQGKLVDLEVTVNYK